MAKPRTPSRKPPVDRAAPPPIPAKPRVTRVPIELESARLIAHSNGELVFSSADASVFVDAKRWPPRVVFHHGQHVRYAARNSLGTWLVYARSGRDENTWMLRWFDKITAPLHSKENPGPVAARERGPFYAELDESRRVAESADERLLEGVEFCGPLTVVVPRHVGLGERRLPYVQWAGVWVEERSLAPLEKPLAEVASTHPTRSSMIIDGPYILVWNGRVYVPLANEFVEFCSSSVSLGADHCAPVPSVGGGLFALQGTTLVEVQMDVAREHLPGVTVRGLQGGPDKTLVVDTETGPLLYDPNKHEAAELGALVGEMAAIVGMTKVGDLLVFDRGANELRRITRRELAKVARRRTDIAPEVPAPPAVVLDALGAASRPTIAAAADIIVGCTEDAVRFWNLDLVVAKVSLAAIAVAQRESRTAVLDARGVLHELDGFTGRLLGSQPVTGQPRSLVATTDDRWIVIAKDAVSVVGPHGIDRIEVADAIAAAFDPDGAIVIVSEGRRLARWELGQLFDIPESIEQIVAIAPLGGRRFVCAGQRNLFVLDLAHPELEALYEANATPFIAASPNGRSVAWATTSSASIGTITGTTLAEVESVQYPGTYAEPSDEPLLVCGLAFLDDERVAVAVAGGHGGNVLDFVNKKTKKLDPHPGDTRTRWLFTFAGGVLIAEDP